MSEVKITDAMIEAGAKAAYELWQNVPACPASKSWEERDKELPGSTAFFRKISRAALSAALLPDVSGAEAVAWRWDQATNEGDWQTAFTEHGEPQPSPTVHNVTPLYSRPSAPVEKALARALDFIESLTADPLLMGLDDIEMALEDVQAHASIELDSIRKQLARTSSNVREVTDEMVDVAVRTHAPQFDQMDRDIQSYAREQMRAALHAALQAEGK